MPIAIKMPALSPTMEEGTLAKWLVKVGDSVSAGDIMAEIETDKATMEFEAVDEGVISPAPAATPAPAPASSGDRIVASPLAKRIAEQKGVDLSGVTGSGPNGRIVKADVDGAKPGAAAPAPSAAAAATPAPSAPAEAQDFGIPHEVEKLSGMRKTIARRLTESKQTVPHIYLTVDIRLDALLKLRSELNAALEPQGVKLSVNDLMIKALGKSLEAVPACNVQFAGDTMLQFKRADVSVAVSIPGGLITPIVTDAGSKAVSKISTEMKDLAGRAKEGKLAPEEYVGGTASLSNMGMFGIKQFEAVINPPQGMIMAIGAGDKRPYVVDDSLQIASVMSATGSFDHRAIDGADGAQLMKAFKEMIEAPLGLVA